MPHDHSAFAPHDHDACAADAMAMAEDRLALTGQRLTPVRRQTLQILLASPRALGAYEVLERLVAEGFANQPPVAYRALEFLEEQGLVRRLPRLNAFTA
ncbi:MAG: transcriptional repressor, partial [Pseudorhodobacter sp.]|nr:transcriptional repressor [Pseudorhodobacter sp.]